MGIASRFNKARKFDVDTTGFGYKKLPELFGENGAKKVYKIAGVYINTKGKFDDAPVLAVIEGDSGYFVNLPSHLLDTANEIINDDEAVAVINTGKLGFTIYTYNSKNVKGKTLYSIEFVDM